METFRFYSVSIEYADFLRENYDRHVAFIERDGYRHNKFFIGVVLNINNLDYFAPISSFKNKNDTTFNIYEKDVIISSVRKRTKGIYKMPFEKSIYEMYTCNFTDLEIGAKEWLIKNKFPKK